MRHGKVPRSVKDKHVFFPEAFKVSENDYNKLKYITTEEERKMLKVDKT